MSWSILYQHELKSLNKEATSVAQITSCIDLIALSHCPRSFFIMETYITGLSDCHKLLVLSVCKTTFYKTHPREIMYKDFKNFDEEFFNTDLRTSLSSERIHDHTSFENTEGVE